MTDQLTALEIAVEAKLNRRPACAQCEDHPRLVDGCGRCKGSGLEPDQHLVLAEASRHNAE